MWVYVLVSVVALGASSGASAAVSAYDATDEELVNEFLRLLQARDTAGLDAFLSPQLLLQRGDGTYVGKEEYLKNPAVVDEYSLANVVGRGVENVRVVRYELASIEWIDGVELTRDPVVRMSVFHWNGEQWQLLAHANFIDISKL